MPSAHESDSHLDTAEVPTIDRSALTATTFLEIVDPLVGEFDVIDVLTSLASRCVELLDVAAAGILLAASTEQVQLLELFQLQSDEGPCLDCYRTGLVVASERLDAESPWPVFAAESLRVGFPSVCAVPLRLHDVVLGCLNLFMRDPVPLGALDVALARALADVASIAIVQDQATREAAVREGQLQHALSSRIVIEQAKGMLAEFAGVDMDHAFARLRSFARNRNRRLTEVAAELVAGSIAVAQVSPGRVPPPPAGKASPPPA